MPEHEPRAETENGAWSLERFQAVLFDMDGVITDSMPYHYEAWRRVFEGLGISISEEEVLKREGEQGMVTLRSILAENGRSLPPRELERLLREKEAIFRSLARPRLFPEAEGLVKDARDKGKKLALVTGTSRSEVETNLPGNLLACFDVLVTGDLVTRGKPHPEPYLTALRLLDVPAEQALVIENAPFGIRSAKAAGVACVAVATSLPIEYLHEADKAVSSLSELHRLLFPAELQGS